MFLDTNGSVLVAALFHAATNVFLVSPTNPVGDDLTFRWSPSGSNGSWPCWCSPGATGPERLTFEASPFAGVTDRVR